MEQNLINIISELDECIASGKTRLKTILAALDWTEEATLKKSTFPKNKIRKKSYDKNDPLLPKSFGCENTIVIDDDKLKYVLADENVSKPKKVSDVHLNFTREQKLKLYEYTIDHTTKLSEPELKVSFSNDEYSMTFAEIVAKAKKKDKKIQRKYRTSKPTHTEEVRNLVHLQMQALDKYFNPSSEKTAHKSSKDRSRHDSGRTRSESRFKRRSRSRSRDRSRSRVRSRRSRSRDISDRNINDKRTRVIRSRSKDRSYDSSERKSSSAERKRKQSSERRKKHKDEISVDRKRKRKNKSRSPMSSSTKVKKTKKKHKHHHRR